MVTLVFVKKARNRDLISVDWPTEDENCQWSSLHFEQTIDQTSKPRHHYAGRETLVRLFGRFISNLAPAPFSIYALLGFSHNRPRLNDLSPFSLNIARLSKGRGNKPDSVYLEVRRERLGDLFSFYDDWLITPWTFFISKTAIDDWATQVESIERSWTVRRDLLSRFDALVLNDFEHGLDVMTCTMPSEAFLSATEEVARELGVPVEVRESYGSLEPKRGISLWIANMLQRKKTETLDPHNHRP